MRELVIAFILVTFYSITLNTPPQPQVLAQEQTKTAQEAPKKASKKKVVKRAPKKQKAVQQAQKQPQRISQPVSVPSAGSVSSIIIDAANKHGVDPNRALRIAQCESGLNPNAVNLGYNENGYPSGLFQHLGGYWPARAAQHGYAGASVFDPVANANVTMAMWASGSAGLWECQ